MQQNVIEDHCIIQWKNPHQTFFIIGQQFFFPGRRKLSVTAGEIAAEDKKEIHPRRSLIGKPRGLSRRSQPRRKVGDKHSDTGERPQKLNVFVFLFHILPMLCIKNWNIAA